MSNKLKALLIILAGIILVAVGVFASFMLIQRFQASLDPLPVDLEPIKTSVVVMTRDRLLGDRLSAADMEIISVPLEIAPRNVVTSPDAAEGKIIKSDLIQGQMLLTNMLADPTNNNQDLSFILSDEHVLFAFPAHDLMSQENMVQRGDIIDIFASFTQQVRTFGEVIAETGDPQEPELRTFTVNTMQRVDVTALVVEVIEEDADSGGFMQDGTAITSTIRTTGIRAYLLALRPQDALILKHLNDTNAIFDIVLRSPTSTIEFDLTPVTEQYIIEFYGLEILP